MLHTLRPGQEDACIFIALCEEGGKDVTFKAMWSCLQRTSWWALTKLSCCICRAPRTVPKPVENQDILNSLGQVTLNLSPRDLFSNSCYDLSPTRSTFFLLRINKGVKWESREWSGNQRSEMGIKGPPFLLDNHGWFTLFIYQILTEHLLSDGPENTM